MRGRSCWRFSQAEREMAPGRGRSQAEGQRQRDWVRVCPSVRVCARVRDGACCPQAWLQLACTRVHWEVGLRQRRAWATPGAGNVPRGLGETSPGDHSVHSPDPRCPPKEPLGMDESPRQDATWHMAHRTRPKGRRRPRIRGPPLCCAAAPHPPHTWQISHSPGLSFPTCTVGTSSASQICRQSLCPGLGATDSGRSAREASHGWTRGQDCPVPCGSPRHADQPWAVGPHASPPHSGHLVKGPPPGPTSLGHAARAARCFLPPGAGSGALAREAGHGPGPFVPAFLCLPTLCSANGNRSMFAVSTPAGTQ